MEDDENEDNISDNPSQFHKKKKRIDENEVKLLQIENNYSKKIVRIGLQYSRKRYFIFEVQVSSFF